MKRSLKQNINESIEALSLAKVLAVVILLLPMLGGLFLIVEGSVISGIYIVLGSILFYFFIWILLRIWSAVNIANQQMQGRFEKEIRKIE